MFLLPANLRSGCRQSRGPVDRRRQKGREFIFAQDPFHVRMGYPLQQSCLGNRLSRASRHATGENGRQGETKRDKAKSSQPSIQTSDETRGDKERQSKVISAQHPNMPHGRQGETKRYKARQSKIISAQHPDMP